MSDTAHKPTAYNILPMATLLVAARLQRTAISAEDAPKIVRSCVKLAIMLDAEVARQVIDDE